MKIIKVLFLFISISCFAQSKVGTVNVDFVLSKMTEFPQAQKDVEAYAKELDTQFETNYKKYETMVQEYQATENTLTIKQKQAKQDSIITNENDLNSFRQNASKLISLRRDEILRPLYNKIAKAIEKVAKAGSFTQILQIDDSLVYLDDNYDITIAVLADMGITITEEDKN